MKVLVFNLATDDSHPALAFTTQWIKRLAAEVDTIDVLTMWEGPHRLPANVRVVSAGGERGVSRRRRAVTFVASLWRLLQAHSIDVCFSHMMPWFSALGGPLLRAHRVPMVLWYAHPTSSLHLRIAHRWSSRVVTSFPGSFPLPSKKVSIIGQGIDTHTFAPSLDVAADDRLVLSVGRLSPSKRQDVLLEAMAIVRKRLGVDARVVFVGSPMGDEADEYFGRLRSMVARLDLDGAVSFAGPAVLTELPAWYRRCAVHVNLTPRGFGDKVALEAMSCGRPSIVANTDFQDTLGKHTSRLLAERGDVDDLARKLGALLTCGTADRERMGADLRAEVERRHGLDTLPGRLLAVFEHARRAADLSPELSRISGAC